MFEGLVKGFKNIINGFKKSVGNIFVSSSGYLFGSRSTDEYKSWAYACMTVISDRFSGLQRHLEDAKGNLVDHKNKSLINTELLQYSAISLQLYGEVYFLIIRGANGKIISLEYVNKNYIVPKLSGYIQTGWTVGAMDISMEDVIVFRQVNPFNSFGYIKKGYSPYIAASDTIKAEHDKEYWNDQLIENGAMPGLIIEIPEELDRDAQERLKQKIDDKYGNVKNKSKTMVLSGGMKANKDFILSHKEMDFIEGIKWDMQKIMAIFKVPKAMLGMGESVNVGNVKAFEDIFARNVILPLSIKISEGINKYILNGEAFIFFDNVIPKDEDEIRNNYNTGAITRNEMRIALGYTPIKGGDVFVDGLEAMIDTPKKNVEKTAINSEFNKKMLEAIQEGVTKGEESLTKGTEEYNEKRQKIGVKRQLEFEKILKNMLLRVFKQQKSSILKEIESSKGLKLSVPSLGNTFNTLYTTLLLEPFLNFIKSEGQIATDEVLPGSLFVIDTEERKKTIRDDIVKLAEQVDSITDEKLKKVISDGVSNGLTPDQVSTAINSIFDELSKSRVDMIVRTESVRSATLGQTLAWKDTGLVSGKEWYTAVDERVCEYCRPMHGKVIDIDDNYFKKGDTYVGSNGGKMKLDYSDTLGAPLHPNCRCTLIPVVKSIDEL